LTKAPGPHVIASAEPSAVLSHLQKQVEIRVIAQDAVVVAPAKPLVNARSGSTSAPTSPELVIALDPREVSQVTQALATNVQLTAITRSAQRSQPQDEAPTSDHLKPEDVTPGLNPLEGIKALEAMVGGKRETMLFVGGGRGEQNVAGRTVVNRPAITAPSPEVVKPPER